MKIVYNRLLPFKGYRAMAFFGIILARKECRPLSVTDIRHEWIHKAQAKDCGGWLWFYLRYIGYWIRTGYRSNPFEREAFANDDIAGYLERRPANAWKQYLE